MTPVSTTDGRIASTFSKLRAGKTPGLALTGSCAHSIVRAPT
jgi:hypothetical protein